MKLKELLKEKLTEKEIALMPSSFDTVGDILIFNDFPEELKKKEKKIGEEILKKLKHIKVVAKKTGKYSGRYRTPKLKIIAGEKRTETVHKENGVVLKLDIEKAYFSARTSTERKRIAQLVKPEEKILVMFSGIAPLPAVIAKNASPKEITGIEINKTAHKYALENVKLNKIKDIKLYCGDVRKIMPKINTKFDRILMPLPKTAEEFLDTALPKIKKNGIIHVYSFISLERAPEMAEKIKKICLENGKKCSVKNIVKCGQFSPAEYRMCFDVLVH
jgi:tRNA (guanine37-N1)-methyltransferase